MNWTKEDAAAAQAQGWDLVEYWENGHFGWVIQRHGEQMLSDESARLYVAHRAKTTKDALCQKAVTVVFRSQMPDFEKTARTTKQRRRRA